MSIETVVIVGSGEHIISGHVPFLGNVRVIGVYDPEEASRQALADALGYEPPAFSTPERLLAARPDGALIGSPEYFHPEQLAQAVEAGIPVLYEKPLAIDRNGLAIVDHTLRTAQTNNLFVASCHPRRSIMKDLPYGWIRANLTDLESRFGRLLRIRFSSNYPLPEGGWEESRKRYRSFLADKFVHDIDYMRCLLGDSWFRAIREIDNYDHYIVTGYLMREMRDVDFSCEGTRLHNDRDAHVEYVILGFEQGTCVVYTKSGTVRYFDRRTGEHSEDSITRMIPDSYDRLYREVTDNFLRGKVVHRPIDLLANTAAVVALTGPSGQYEGR